jgi:hypothetical protein
MTTVRLTHFAHDVFFSREMSFAVFARVHLAWGAEVDVVDETHDVVLSRWPECGP